MKTSAILGLNARTQLYSYPFNTTKGKSVATSKIRTKRYLKKNGIPIPEIYAVFKKPEDIIKFDWSKLPDSFALKPNKGLGGDGIIIVKKKSKDGNGWLTTLRSKVNVEDLKLHVMDILEGAFSISNVPDVAYIEEYVGRHKAFRKYAYRGTPDIRVIVFNKVPVMAMLRLPTKGSKGRGNLHQGAIAVGVDIATGITTKALLGNKQIRHKPGTKRKLHGIKIPNWTTVLELAVTSGESIGLNFFGSDIVHHPEKGPMVLEINYMPGLTIQIANDAGLKKRLEKVEDLKVRDAEHGVKIAKAFFASSFADRVKAKEGIRTLSVFEEIKIKSKDGKRIKTVAKLDTGAWRTSIDRRLAEDLGLLEKDNVLWFKKVKGAIGSEERPVINLTFWLAGKKMKTPASVAKRLSLKFPVIIGRKNLKGILINPEISAVEKREKIQKV
ncbi:sugar-transfer associated ATP-grasp domain-containing protein [Patescibacteria group bacterium]